jgi:hypothetical protein
MPIKSGCKICSRCSVEKPLEDFFKATAMRDGRQNYCKECSLAHARARWETEPEFRKSKRDRKRERYQTDPKYRDNVQEQNRISSNKPANKARKKKNAANKYLNECLAKWGLTLEDYETLVVNGCVICGGPPNGRGRYHFDHDHETGKFRGLLCALHNAALGHFGEDPALLRKAADYIENHRNQEAAKKEPK